MCGSASQAAPDTSAPCRTDNVVYVVGHKHPDTDSIVSAIALAHLRQALGHSDVHPARAGALNAETQYVLARFNLAVPDLLTSGRDRRLILVDHNEVAQAVDDIAQASVLEVWEHHRLGDLPIPHPIVFHCEPLGATATLIAEQYALHDVPLPAGMAGALLAAIVSDTLVFASPTCTEKDRRIARRLEAVAGVDATTLGRDLLAARGDPAQRLATDLVREDFKEFEFGGSRVGIAQVEVVDAAPLLARRGELMAELRRVHGERGLAHTLLLITDISRKGSYVWSVGDRRDVLERACGQPLVGDAIYLEGWMSRKKQVVPALEHAFAGTP